MTASPSRSSVAVAVALIFAGTCQAADRSAFQSQCQRLAHIDQPYLATESANPNSFWSNPTLRQTYLTALKGTPESAKHAVGASDDGEAARAAVMLAGLVKHDSRLLQIGYSDAAARYFNGRTIFTPLTMAASCDFGAGVTFLLQKHLDPNDGADVGAFNAALANQNTVVERQLLEAGYQIDGNAKRCLSSKQILAKNEAATLPKVRTAIESSTCPAVSSGEKS